MDQTEQAPAKRDWREVERERLEKQQLRWRKQAPVLLAANVVLFLVSAVMFVIGPRNFEAWFFLGLMSYNLAMSYYLRKAYGRSLAK